MPRKLKGIIRRAGQKPKAYVDVIIDGKPRQKAKRFPIGTTDEVMAEWRARVRKAHAKIAPPTPVAGSFAADVDEYLEKPEVAAQAYVKQKTAHLSLWIEALGRDRPRGGITRDELESVIQAWLKAGLSETTVYHRRSSLQSLYSTLDGPHAGNAVRDTTCPAHENPIDRSIPFEIIAKIIASMPDHRFTKKGIRVLSVAKACASVIAHTGIPPAELLKIHRGDIDWHLGIVQMPRRKKGKGTDATTRVLTPEGIAAFRAFDAANAYGRFSPNAISRSLKKAFRRVLGPDTPRRLYDLRHSFGKDIYEITGDLATVGRLLGHAEGSRVTARYAQGANVSVDRAALTTLSGARTARLQASKEPAQNTPLPKTLPSRRKAITRRRLRKVS